MKDFGLDLATESVIAHPSAGARPGVYALTGKRIFDIVLGILSLPLIVPVILIMWLMVRRDGGPGLYSQTRIGMNGKKFRCWKMRSMVVNADQALKDLCEKDPEIAREWHKNQKLADDPRITRIGRFMRSTSLDELPQIWNIIKGDMSFVGPRPFIWDQAPLYDAAGGRAYYTVRPGITGTWQVYGRGTTSFIDRVKFDALYCRELSLTNDLLLIWKTFGVVLRRTGG